MKKEVIKVENAKVDDGSLSLNLASPQNGQAFAPNDTIGIVQGQECYINTFELNGEARPYRAIPFYLNGEAVEEGVSVNTLFSSRYVPVNQMDKAEKLADGSYRMTWNDYFKVSKPRFRSLTKVARKRVDGDKVFLDIIDDAECTLCNVGDVLLQNFDKTTSPDNSETVVNKQGKTVRKWIILSKAEDYIAQA